MFFFSVALLSSFFASSGVQEINTTNVAEAAENPSQPNEGLVPCGRTLGPDMEPDPCTLCHFFVGFHNIITWGMKIMTFVAIFVIVIAGVTYIISAGNENIIGIAK
ncbi:MAG TPA: hypothetical protein VJH89_00185, partial [Patescibacteria group bacterium]|nr:hypothetical protein [Patescibacteria group bacterium]